MGAASVPGTLATPTSSMILGQLMQLEIPGGLDPVNLPELGFQITDVRCRIDLGACDSLNQFLRLELGSVAVDILAQPAQYS